MPTFVNEKFPIDYSAGSSGGPGYDSNILRAQNGQIVVVRRQAAPIHEYQVSFDTRALSVISSAKAFLLAMEGAAYSFRFQDLWDFNSSVAGYTIKDGSGAVVQGTSPTNLDQVIGIGDGSTTTFQLVKRYATTSKGYNRPIRLPISGTVTVALNGVNQASGWTVNLTTGVITFTTPPGVAVVITAGFEFDVMVMCTARTDRQTAIEGDDITVGTISFSLEEVPNPNAYDEDRRLGGWNAAVTMSANVTLDAHTMGERLDPQSAGLKAFLPALSDMPDGGGPIKVIHNANATNSLLVRDSGDTTTVATIAATETWEFYIEKTDAGGTRAWLAFS